MRKVCLSCDCVHVCTHGGCGLCTVLCFLPSTGFFIIQHLYSNCFPWIINMLHRPHLFCKTCRGWFPRPIHTQSAFLCVLFCLFPRPPRLLPAPPPVPHYKENCDIEYWDGQNCTMGFFFFFFVSDLFFSFCTVRFKKKKQKKFKWINLSCTYIKKTQVL